MATKLPGTNMPKPKSTKAPLTKNMPKKVGSIGKMVNLGKARPKPTVPPDYDVIIPGFNDRATVNRLNKEAAARAAAKKKAKK